MEEGKGDVDGSGLWRVVGSELVVRAGLLGRLFKGVNAVPAKGLVGEEWIERYI